MLDGNSIGEGLITIGYQPWTDYIVTTQATVQADSPSSRDASLVVRYNSPTDFYWVGIGNWGHFASISKVVAGTYQELVSKGLSSEVVFGAQYDLKVIVKGTLIQFYVNNILQVEYNDNSFSNGGVGFRVWGSHVQYAYIDVAEEGASPIPWLPLGIIIISVAGALYVGAKM